MRIHFDCTNPVRLGMSRFLETIASKCPVVCYRNFHVRHKNCKSKAECRSSGEIAPERRSRLNDTIHGQTIHLYLVDLRFVMR